MNDEFSTPKPPVFADESEDKCDSVADVNALSGDHHAKLENETLNSMSIPAATIQPSSQPSSQNLNHMTEYSSSTTNTYSIPVAEVASSSNTENLQLSSNSELNAPSVRVVNSDEHVTQAEASPRSTASSSAPDKSDTYHIKWISYQNKSTPIITQNENGPCPMIAIANVLLLRGSIRLPERRAVVTGSFLLELLSNKLLSEPVDQSDPGYVENSLKNLDDALNLFPMLQTGLDINVRFTGVTDFEYTSELSVFDQFKIDIYHGWLVDPEQSLLKAAVSNRTYNQLIELVLELKSSSDTDAVNQGLIVEEFLSQSAAQLTSHGLSELVSKVKVEQPAVLFRNNHFSTITKIKDRIYVLVTDMGLLHEPSVVWEELNDVDGNTQFVNASFQIYHAQKTGETAVDTVPNNERHPANYATGTSHITKSVPKSDSSDLDALKPMTNRQKNNMMVEKLLLKMTDPSTSEDMKMAIQLQLDEMQLSDSGSLRSRPVSRVPSRNNSSRNITDSDHQLASRLQREELNDTPRYNVRRTVDSPTRWYPPPPAYGSHNVHRIPHNARPSRPAAEEESKRMCTTI